VKLQSESSPFPFLELQYHTRRIEGDRGSWRRFYRIPISGGLSGAGEGGIRRIDGW
jgi:hypothetical protein